MESGRWRRGAAGQHTVACDDLVKFGPKAFSTASPTVFNNPVQLVMDSDKLPAAYGRLFS